MHFSPTRQPAEAAAQPPVSSHHRTPRPFAPPSSQSHLQLIRFFKISVGSSCLTGELAMPQQASGIVLLVHGADTSSRSSRSRHMTRLLQQADLGTFSIDLFTGAEAQRQPIAPLNQEAISYRVAQIAVWLQHQPAVLGMRFGLLGEGRGATALLEACPALNLRVGGAVTLGNCTIASDAPASSIPTLLLVGEQDATSQQQCRQVQERLGATSQLRAIPAADAQFQQAGTLASAMQQAGDWFNRYLPSTRAR